MNAASRALNHGTIVTTEGLRALLFSKTMLAMAGLVCGILFSALGLIYVQDAERQLTSQLVKLQQSQETLQVQYDQLLLEQNTWASQQRLQRVAQAQLGMDLPKKIITIQTNA